MRVIVLDNDVEVFTFEADRAAYPADQSARTKVVVLLTDALRYLLRVERGKLDGEV